MFQLHTIYIISLVSQVTSALVLSLLAWADRRAHWLIPLAIACGLHSAAIYLMPLWRGTGRWVPQAFSAAILILMLYMIHLGMQALVFPHQRRSARTHAAICATMLLLFALASYSSLWCVEASQAAAIVLLAWTIHMLWKAPIRELRWPLRATAVLLFALAMHFLVRLPLELLNPTSRIFLLLRESTVLLVTSMAFSFLAIYGAETRRRLHDESRLDVLTGLPNRRAMEEGAAEQLKLAARHGRPCALLMVDLDHFKWLNDTWGHNVGDQALLAAGGLLLRAAREIENCNVARMGGEEFAMLLSDSSVATAHAVAEQLCCDMAALRIWVGEEEVGFTASVGVSALKTGETNWMEMLRRADVAMYKAKQEGRNRVMLCTEVLPNTLTEETTRTAFARFG
jgi:diguanylate cyclase (GGDEF)-like protein